MAGGTGAYLTEQDKAATVHSVIAGDREFLVIQAFKRILVFQRMTRPAAFIQRRELVSPSMDPELAVAGYLLQGFREVTQIEDMQRRLDDGSRSRGALLGQIERLQKKLILANKGKRGKRGRRNT